MMVSYSDNKNKIFNEKLVFQNLIVINTKPLIKIVDNEQHNFSDVKEKINKV